MSRLHAVRSVRTVRNVNPEAVYLPRFIVYLAVIAFGAVILSLFLHSEQEGSGMPAGLLIDTQLNEE